MAQSFEALVIGPGVSTGDTQHSDLDAAWVNIDSDEAESTSSEWDSPQVSPREKARPPADKGVDLMCALLSPDVAGVLLNYMSVGRHVAADQALYFGQNHLAYWRQWTRAHDATSSQRHALATSGCPSAIGPFHVRGSWFAIEGCASDVWTVKRPLRAS